MSTLATEHAEMVAAIQAGAEAQARFFKQLDDLRVNVIRVRRDLDDAVDILTALAETLPERCGCNFETVEGRTVGQECLPHKALHFLEAMR